MYLFFRKPQWPPEEVGGEPILWIVDRPHVLGELVERKRGRKVMHMFDGRRSDASVRLVVVWDGLAADALKDLVNTLETHEEQRESTQQSEN